MSVTMNEALVFKLRPGCGLEVPDPYRPANLHRYEHVVARQCSKRWINHQERRSSILAAARRLMVDAGFEGVCFRDIAGICEISVPTIYNIVGDRAEVLNQASMEWVYWLGAAASVRSDAGNKVLQLMQKFWISALDFPDYTKTAARVLAAPDHPLSKAFHNSGSALIGKWLTELRAQGQLRSLVAIDSLARQLALSVNAGICNWALAPYDEARFKRDFASGPGLMLLGAVHGSEIEVVEQALEMSLN